MTPAEAAGLALLCGWIREAVLLAEIADGEDGDASGPCPPVAGPVTSDA